MFKALRDKEFIAPRSRFLLLFIGKTREQSRWEQLLSEEIIFCKNSPKSTLRAACEPQIIDIANSAEYASTTWRELMEFNETYVARLDAQNQQVERKLLWGFNESVASKAFMQEVLPG
jgi:hypothetical protein